MNRFNARWLIRRDMFETLEIDRLSFGEDAWQEEDFLRVLRERNVIPMVVESGERVVGFAVYELHKSKLVVLRFAIHPEFRRMRAGSVMMAKLIAKLSSHRRTRLLIDVPDDNLAAHLFLRSNDFIGRTLDSETYRFVYRVPSQVCQEICSDDIEYR